MDFVRDNKIPVVALNIRESSRKKIRRNGIEGLSEEERKTLPEIDTTDIYHRRYLERIKKRHGDDGGGYQQFECCWFKGQAAQGGLQGD